LQNNQNTITVKKLYFAFLTLCFLTGCGEEKFYPKVSENFSVANKTDTPFVVIWDRNMFQEYLPFDTVHRFQERHYNANKNNYDLWLTEKQLNELFSKMVIFRIENTDTLFVNKAYYSDLDCWKNQKFTDDWFGSTAIYNSHFITITNDMFIVK